MGSGLPQILQTVLHRSWMTFPQWGQIRRRGARAIRPITGAVERPAWKPAIPPEQSERALVMIRIRPQPGHVLFFGGRHVRTFVENHRTAHGQVRQSFRCRPSLFSRIGEGVSVHRIRRKR